MLTKIWSFTREGVSANLDSTTPTPAIPALLAKIMVVEYAPGLIKISVFPVLNLLKFYTLTSVSIAQLSLQTIHKYAP